MFTYIYSGIQAHTHTCLSVPTPRNFIIPMRAGKRLARKSNETWQNKEKQHTDQEEEAEEKKTASYCVVNAILSAQLE